MRTLSVHICLVFVIAVVGIPCCVVPAYADVWVMEGYTVSQFAELPVTTQPTSWMALTLAPHGSPFGSDLYVSVATGNYGSASCLVNGHPNTPYDDDRADPAVGDGYYYVLRARNGCGIGSYGDSSLSPDPRDDLNPGPCP